VVSDDNAAHPRLKTAARARRFQTDVPNSGVILVIPEIPGVIRPDMN
jgi:hypothetical protein